MKGRGVKGGWKGSGGEGRDEGMQLATHPDTRARVKMLGAAGSRLGFTAVWAVVLHLYIAFLHTSRAGGNIARPPLPHSSPSPVGTYP